jgi:hypothetical protein
MGIDATVSVGHFHLNGIDYFRSHASSVQLGDVGEKQMPGDREPHLAVRASLAREALWIDAATQIGLHGVGVSGSDIGASLAIPGVGRLSAGSVARQLEDQALCLVRLGAAPQAMVEAANRAPEVLAELIRAGSHGRLVHQVLVILEMTTALNFTRATRFESTGSRESWAVTAIASGSRTVVTLTPGTTFAYLLLKPTWNAKQPRDWQRIEGWEDDPWRLD